MSDGNLTREIIEKMIKDYGPCKCGAAATAWIKYNPDPQAIGQPGVGEWLLWSIVTEHGREYYSGSLLHDRKRIHAEYGRTWPITDQVYFARVRMMDEPETDPAPSEEGK